MAARLHHRDDGPRDAPALVLSSSLGATGAMWEAQIAELSSRFRTIAYDHRGHGGSERPPGPYSVADLGEDVIALLDELDVARAHFCGLSLGGMVAIWLGAHAPERIASLAICCSSAHPGNEEMWRGRAETVERDGSVAGVADAIVARWTTPGYAAAHPEAVARLRQMLASQPPDGYAPCCRALAGLDLRAELAQITAPTLVVSGAGDEALPPIHQQLIADALSGGRMASIDPGAHLPNVEQPAVFNKLVSDHIGEHS